MSQHCGLRLCHRVRKNTCHAAMVLLTVALICLQADSSRAADVLAVATGEELYEAMSRNGTSPHPDHILITSHLDLTPFADRLEFGKVRGQTRSIRVSTTPFHGQVATAAFCNHLLDNFSNVLYEFTPELSTFQVREVVCPCLELGKQEA
jgi:hypothetical protein